MADRTAEIRRKTGETDIRILLDLDGTGERRKIDTGIGFFDHMLDAFARHGFFDLEVKCTGDLNVDGHHTVEDTGIVLGQAILQAAGDKKGIRRYGAQILPMDETLALCAVDLCGRPYFVMDAHFPVERVGDFETQLVREFFYAVSYSAMMNLHLRILREDPFLPPPPPDMTRPVGNMTPPGEKMTRPTENMTHPSENMTPPVFPGVPGNAHHMIEAMFKAFARALDEAVSPEARISDVLSTKGVL